MKYTSIHVYLFRNIKMITHKLLYISFFYEYGFGILLINICVYLLLLALFFEILFLFNLKNLKTLNEFKGLNSYNFILMSIMLTLLSLAGMPPLCGFVGKFFLLDYLISRGQYILFVIFSLINLFMIFFYTQNIRFMIRKVSSRILLVKNYYVNLDTRMLIIIILTTFINLFGIFFFEDFLYIINSWTSYTYIG